MQSDFGRDRRNERGVTIIIVTVAIVFIVLAVAALAIDIGAMYNARGEAKQAADAAALAGAKALANSGMTSDPSNVPLQTAAQTLARQVAIGVALQNKVGGRALTGAEVTVTFPNVGTSNFVINPQVSVTVQRTDVPTFFARAWGTRIVAVGATAVAEAFNPSNSASVSVTGDPVPIAPQCVKPWIIPNLDLNTGLQYFAPGTGAVTPGLVGTAVRTFQLSTACPVTGCALPLPPLPAGRYYPASLTPPSASTLPSSCSPPLGGCSYQENIAGCSPQPIACGVLNNAAVDLSACASNKTLTRDGTRCLIHTQAGRDTFLAGTPPEFHAGNSNPLVLNGLVAVNDHITTSDSLVTIPVYDGAAIPAGQVTIIGFLQAFITSAPAGGATGNIQVRIVNISGCGTGPTGSPVQGDGVSSVPVHLITP